MLPPINISMSYLYTCGCFLVIHINWIRHNSTTNHKFTFRLLSVNGSDNIRQFSVFVRLCELGQVKWTWWTWSPMQNKARTQEICVIQCTWPFTDSKLHWAALWSSVLSFKYKRMVSNSMLHLRHKATHSKPQMKNH